MNERWRRLLEIYEAARGLPASERLAYIAKQCGDDAELADELERMLAEDPPAEFMTPPEEGGEVGAEKLLASNLTGRQFGDFKILRELGRGGMGVVYLAHQARLERIVAIKVLPAIHGAGEHAERFRREARAASKLTHPNIASVMVSGVEEGLAWYAMTYVEGHDLHVELVRQRCRLRGEEPEGELQLPSWDSSSYITEVVERIAELAQALHYAHGEGVVHRDVKPRNILIGRDGRFILVDFGLARDSEAETMTATGAIHGTPHYMSPEQAHAVRNPIDHRTDVYSLAVVLYELLSLKRPYDGETSREVLSRVASGVHLELRKASPIVARDLAVICEKAMSRQPEDRYADAGAFAEDLLRFLQHKAIAAKRPSLVQRVRRFARARPVLTTLLSMLLVTVVGAFVLAKASAARTRELGWSERIEGALAEVNWHAHPNAAVDAQQAVLEAQRAEQDGAVLQDLTERFSQRLIEMRMREVLEVRELIEVGKHGRAYVAGAPPGPSSTRDLSRALSLLSSLALFFPGDSELDALRRQILTVRLRLELSEDSAQGEATAHALPLDPITGEFGEPQPLGALPLDTELPPGDWRVVVEIPGLGLGEYDRFFRLEDEPYKIQARIRSDTEAHVGMVRLPALRFRFDDPPEMGCCQVAPSTQVASFWIDEAEVSNREYLEFLDATGHEAPILWNRIGYAGDWRTLPGVDGNPSWLELPIAGISFYDARDFAEWAGKRLPTHFELERALRGEASLRATPLTAASRANVEGPPVRDVSGSEARFRQYVENALAVRANGYRQEPSDLYHGYGNVSEWTSSKLVQEQLGHLYAHDWIYIHMGGAWSAVQDESFIYEHPNRGVDTAYVGLRADVGLRCARSANSPPRLGESHGREKGVQHADSYRERFDRETGSTGSERVGRYVPQYGVPSAEARVRGE